jgi:uncharacterized protein (TIGR02453 family)
VKQEATAHFLPRRGGVPIGKMRREAGMTAGRFEGFPREAFGFFKELEQNNNREWFQAHKDVYEQACRAPMQALMSELEPELGASKISRLNRDMRFSYGRAPYKTHLAAGIGGYYVSLGKEGLYVGAGVYKPDPAALRSLREAIAGDTSGRELAAIVAALGRKGYDVGTHESVASAPRGYAADHPRIELLRMKDIHAGASFTPEPWLSTRKAYDRIVRVMTDLRPFRRWLRVHLPSGPKPEDRKRKRHAASALR